MLRGASAVFFWFRPYSVFSALYFAAEAIFSPESAPAPAFFEDVPPSCYVCRLSTLKPTADCGYFEGLAFSFIAGHRVLIPFRTVMP
jgi:hypothetical protein